MCCEAFEGIKDPVSSGSKETGSSQPTVLKHFLTLSVDTCKQAPTEEKALGGMHLLPYTTFQLK